MNKDKIIKLFIQKGILSDKSGIVRRPSCWRKRLDAEAAAIFASFVQAYRSDEEAWFCLCRKVELPLCQVCHKKRVKFTGVTKNGALGYNTVCESCSANAALAKIAKVKSTCASRSLEDRATINQKRRQTNKAKYGDEAFGKFGSASFKANMLAKHGSLTFNNRQKAKQTCLSKYGVPNNLMLDASMKKAKENAWSASSRKKRIANSIKRNGVKSHLCLNNVKEQCQKTKRQNIHAIEVEHDCTLLADVVKKYGQGFKALKLEYLKIGSHVFIQNKDLETIAKYSAEGTHTNGYVSAVEKEVLSYVRSICTYEIIENDTSVVANENGRFFELDMYIPELHFAIDVNGTYWHSTKFKDKYYHQRKTRCCCRAGIQLLHVFEDEWKLCKQACKDTIKHCISKTYANVLQKDGTTIVGDNAKPVFGSIEILKITQPEKHVVGTNAYYDCGKILYRNKERQGT